MKPGQKWFHGSKDNSAIEALAGSIMHVGDPVCRVYWNILQVRIRS